MTAEERKRESERVMTVQRRHGPHRWIYEPTPAKLAAARERVKRWYRENPERDRERQHRRRASKAGEVAPQWLVVLANDPCAYCGAPGGQVDHIEPLARGGAHEVLNLTSACRSCNSSKGTRSLLTFLRSL